MGFEHAAEFRRALEDGDVAVLRRAWSDFFSHLPQPKTDAEAEIVMHHARTQAVSVAFAKRAYSHRWLTERGLPSGLPDDLRPKAERMYPRVVDAVGISVNARSPLFAPLIAPIHDAMVDAVADAYADNKRDPAFVKARMVAAREGAITHLMGKNFSKLLKSQQGG